MTTRYIDYNYEATVDIYLNMYLQVSISAPANFPEGPK